MKKDIVSKILREDYLNRVPEMDWTYADKEPYTTTATQIGHKVRNKYYEWLKRFGYESEDVIQLCKIYAVYYMNIYSYQRIEEQKSKLLEKYMDNNNGSIPTEDWIRNYDMISMSRFINQKIGFAIDKIKDHLGKECDSFNGYFAFTSQSVSAAPEMISQDHKKYGYRKVSMREMKELGDKFGFRPKSFMGEDDSVVDENGFIVFRINRNRYKLESSDYEPFHTDDRCAEFYQSPEDYLIQLEDQEILSQNMLKFKKAKDSHKKFLVMSFINDGNDTTPSGGQPLKREKILARKIVNSKKALNLLV